MNSSVNMTGKDGAALSSWSRRRFLVAGGAALACGMLPFRRTEGAAAPTVPQPFCTDQGWLTRGGTAWTGYVHENDWWGGLRPDQVPETLRVARWVRLEVVQHRAVNISRRDPGQRGPGRTEELGPLTDALAREGVRGYEHYYGLWWDRRRDTHEVAPRPAVTTEPASSWDNPLPPFYELPWARSGQGVAGDGKSLYDLYQFNDWYFKRMAEFAALCDEKNRVFLYGFYNQHNILEHKSHYVDFPWNPANAIQQTGLPPMPEERRVYAHAAFYDVTDSERARLHRAYFRNTLDVLGKYGSVIFSLGREFTGPASFVRFWLETIAEWETEHSCPVNVCLNGTKDVQDEILAHPVCGPQIDVIDLRGWGYAADGTLVAPKSSPEQSGRYQSKLRQTTAAQLYRQVAECRAAHPKKAVLHAWPGPDAEKNLALFMGGASLVCGELLSDIPATTTYDTLSFSNPIRGFTQFVQTQLAGRLPGMVPRPDLVLAPEDGWCLADVGKGLYLAYAPDADRIMLDTRGAPDTPRSVQWLNPVSGQLTKAGRVTGETVVTVSDGPAGAVLLLSPVGS